VSSKISEEENAETYIRLVQKKATQLLQHSIYQFTSLNEIEVGT